MFPPEAYGQAMESIGAGGGRDEGPPVPMKTYFGREPGGWALDWTKGMV
jgi:hypothetical protein